MSGYGYLPLILSLTELTCQLGALGSRCAAADFAVGDLRLHQVPLKKVRSLADCRVRLRSCLAGCAAQMVPRVNWCCLIQEEKIL